MGPSLSSPRPHTGGSMWNRSCEPVYSRAAGATIRICAEVQEGGRIQATYPRSPTPIIPRRRSLSLPASPPHFHLPPAIPGHLAPAPPISFQLLAGGTSWTGGRRRKGEDGVTPTRESISLPKPSSQHPPKSCPWSRIPGATELCRAGTGRIPSLLPPPGHERDTRASQTLGPGSPGGGATDSQRWGRKDSICLLPTSHPHPGAAEPCCQSQSQALGLSMAHSFRGVSRQRNFHVFPKSEEVGDRAVGDSHLGNTGSSESSCDCSSGPLSASLDCTACWDTGGLKCHLSPPSRMSRGWGGWEEREEVESGAGPEPGGGASLCHLASRVSHFSVLQTSSFSVSSLPPPLPSCDPLRRLETLTEGHLSLHLLGSHPWLLPRLTLLHTHTHPVSTEG